MHGVALCSCLRVLLASGGDLSPPASLSLAGGARVQAPRSRSHLRLGARDTACSGEGYCPHPHGSDLLTVHQLSLLPSPTHYSFNRLKSEHYTDCDTGHRLRQSQVIPHPTANVVRGRTHSCPSTALARGLARLPPAELNDTIWAPAAQAAGESRSTPAPVGHHLGASAVKQKGSGLLEASRTL